MLITHANLITWTDPNQILMDHAVYIQGGRIIDLGPYKQLLERYPAEPQCDAGGQYVMPGNICAHTHFYGAFSRGMSIPGPAPHNFTSILEKLWWPLDQALDEEAVQLSTQVCLVDAIRHGTTTLIDHHASPNCIPGSLDGIAQSVEQSGVRGMLCYEVTDRYGEESCDAGIRENLRFLDRIRQGDNADGRLAATFGLHASLTLSDETLQYCRDSVPAQVGFHIHVAESEADQQDSLAKSGMRVVKRLHKFDLLGENSIFVHAVHVSLDEIALLAETGTWVTHQPRSNMNNAVGIGKVQKMLQAGIRVCLGNDGFSNAMWEEWKTAYLVHKAWQADPRGMPADMIVRIGVYNNSLLANQFFAPARLGSIHPGAAADLIFVDYHPFTPLTPQNLPWHMIFGFHESMVTTTIVSGQVLMKDRELLTIDEAEIAARARKIAPQVWQRYQTFVPS